MLNKQIERIEYIDYLIRNRNTGSADEFSEKLGISRRHTYRLIEYLKDLGAPIIFSKVDNSFIYERPCIIDIKFEVRELTEDECVDLQGGSFCLCYSMSQTPGTFIAANFIPAE